jgi:hypothetical protein
MGPCFSHAETGGESGLAAKNLRRLWQAFRLAEEVGESVGRGQVLLRPLPEGAEVIARPQVTSPSSKAHLVRYGQRSLRLHPKSLIFLSSLNFET